MTIAHPMTLEELFTDRVLYLEPINGLSSVTNPVCYFLASIEKFLVDNCQGLPRASRSLLDCHSSREDILIELARVQCDAAISLPGNVVEHSGQVDPDTYACEVIRREHCFITLKKRIPSLVNRLLMEILQSECRTSREPIFAQVMFDFEFYPKEYQYYLDQLSRYLPDMSVYLILVADNVRPSVHRNCTNKVYVMTTEEWEAFSRSVNENSWHLRRGVL